MEITVLPISVVCYDNIDEIKNFAIGLSKQSIADKLIYLVTCNKCEEKNKLKEELDRTGIAYKVYEPKKNLGYLHGCLYGLKKYSKTHPYVWAMITNTDVTFSEEDFFEHAVTDDSKDESWCIAPNISTADEGILQNPFMTHRASKSKILFYNAVFSNKIFFSTYINLSLMKRKILCSENERSDEEIYAAHGSCFFLKRDCVETIIKNRDSIFMYAEEYLIAEIIRENKKEVSYNKNIHAIHHESQITGKVKYGKKQRWFKNSFRYIYKRFYKN